MSLICQPMPKKFGVSKLLWTSGHPVYQLETFINCARNIRWANSRSASRRSCSRRFFKSSFFLTLIHEKCDKSLRDCPQILLYYSTESSTSLYARLRTGSWITYSWTRKRGSRSRGVPGNSVWDIPVRLDSIGRPMCNLSFRDPLSLSHPSAHFVVVVMSN